MPRPAFRLEQSQAAVLWWQVRKTAGSASTGVQGLSRTSLARAPTMPQVATGTRAPRLPAVMRWRKGRPRPASVDAPMGPSCALTGFLLQSIKGGVSYTETGTDELRNK